MKRATFTLAAVILAGMAVSQDLPPGVLLLSRVKNHIKEDLQQLPDISCLETVQREHREPKGKMRLLDTIRLEVLTNGHKELYASPGDRKFPERPPNELRRQRLPQRRSFRVVHERHSHSDKSGSASA